MGRVLIKKREIVIPGEVLAEGMDFVPGEGTFRAGERILSSVLGLLEIKGRSIKVIPLAGRYIPKPGDYVIGRVDEVLFSSWIVDINSPYMGNLGIANAIEEFIDPTKQDLSDYYDIGDWLFTKILSVGKTKQVQLTMKDEKVRKLSDGQVISINPMKVPRVIGSRGSMIKLLATKTGCNLLVGQNGRVWICGSAEATKLVIKAIRRIERESHVLGLTDRIAKMLEK